VHDSCTGALILRSDLRCANISAGARRGELSGKEKEGQEEEIGTYPDASTHERELRKGRRTVRKKGKKKKK
jgi:hypothetical protein